MNGIVSSVGRVQVSARDISKLKPGQWLNDEIINFYVNLIQLRAGREGPLKVFCFNSFFWTKLAGGDYKKGNLGRWTKTVSISLSS